MSQVSIDQPIEPISDDGSDADSAYTSVASASDRGSVTSSVINYRYENGRRYHSFKDGEYVMPNDEEEQDRMDLLHHVYKMFLGGELHLAPIKDPQRVLDLGTGTGIWAIDFADQYPNAKVIGNDLSPIQPIWVPTNCEFEVDDFEAEWLFHDPPFDYIHGRELAGSVKDYDRLFAQALDHLKPGGYLEFQAFKIDLQSDDGSLSKAPHTIRWCNALHEAANKFGKPLANHDTWQQKMIDAGFIEVHQKVIKVPMSPWAKDAKQREIGKYMLVEQLQAAPAYTNALLSRFLGWSAQEIQILLAHIAADLKNLSVHQYAKVFFLYGRKP